MIRIDSTHTLGATLRAARKQFGLTQSELALVLVSGYDLW